MIRSEQQTSNRGNCHEKRKVNNPIHTMKQMTVLALGVFLTAQISAPAQVTFTQVTNGPVATDGGAFIGAAWGDFRNTGFLDLFVANWNVHTNVFYLNNGDGTFTKVAGRNPVLDPMTTSLARWEIMITTAT